MKAGSTPQVLFTEEQIRGAVREMAQAIREDYEGKDLVAVGVLKGSFVFLADLVRALDCPLEVDFVWLSSYGNRRFTSGEVRIKKDLETPIAGRHVLIVEDIVDTGVTLRFLVDYLRQRRPASIRIATLLDKPECRMATLELDYVGFRAGRDFLVGYGLDDAERYRWLPAICRVEGPPGEKAP